MLIILRVTGALSPPEEGGEGTFALVAPLGPGAQRKQSVYKM